MIMRLTTGVFILTLMAASAIATEVKRKDAYVFRDGDITWMIAQGMSSDSLKEIKSRYGRVFLWARRNGQTFVTSDALVMDQARAVVHQNAGHPEQESKLAAITDEAIRRGTAHRRGSYVLAVDETRTTISAGTTVKNVLSLRDRYRGRFLWVRTGDQTWLIDDPDWLDRASAFFAEDMALAPELRLVAREERELDREAERLQKLRDAHDASSEAGLEQVRRREAEVGRRQAELEDRQEALERVAEAKLWELIDEAIRRAVARRLR